MRKMLACLALAACQLYGGKPERLPRGREPSRQRVMERAAEVKRARAQAAAADAGLPAPVDAGLPAPVDAGLPAPVDTGLSAAADAGSDH